MVTSGARRVNYTNFITGFMNAMDLAFVSSSIFLNWQLLSRGPRAWKFALKFPSAGGGGRVRLHEGYLGISTIFQLVCYVFVSITFALRCYSRSVEARNCRSDRRETGNQIGQTGKTENRNRYQIFFCENRKPDAKKRKIRKPQWTRKLRNRSFLA